MAKTIDGGGSSLHNPRRFDLNPIRLALVVVVWMALVGILMGAGELVDHSSVVQGFDNHVTSFVVAQRTKGLDAVMKGVTWIGTWVALVAAAVVVVLLVLRRQLSVGFLVLAVVAWAGTQVGTTLAKEVVRRPRPPEVVRLVPTHGWSWPSGHTATATLVFGVLATVVWLLTTSVRLRLLAVLGWILAALAVAFSRVELGAHWTTDVLASLVFVTGWLWVLATTFGASGGSGVEAST